MGQFEVTRLLVLVSFPLFAGAVGVELFHGLRYAVANEYWQSGLGFLAAANLQRQVNSGLLFAVVATAILTVAAFSFRKRARSTVRLMLPVWATEVLLLINRAVYGRDWSVTTERFDVGLPNALWRFELLGINAAVAAGLLLVCWLVVRRLTATGTGVPRRIAITAYVLAGAGAAAANVAPVVWPHDTAGHPYNVVFITVDSLRRDHLSGYGYPRPTTPHLSAFLRQSVQFRNALAQHNWTRPSYFSILTSRFKWEFPPQHVSLPLVTLCEALKQNGYRTRAFIQNPNLDFTLYFDQGFDSYYQIYKDLRAKTMSRAVLGSVESLDASGAPFFLFVHYQQPHYPYDLENPFLPRFHPGDGGDLLAPDEVLHHFSSQGRDWDPEKQSLQALFDLYDASIRATDEAIGGLLEALRRKGLLENTLVVFNADHGEEFLDHGRFGHAHQNLHSELIGVPLAVRFPGALGVPPGMVATLAANLDIYPTVLDVLGIPSRQLMYGRSLLPLARGGEEEWEPRVVYSNRGKWMAASSDRYRLCVDYHGELPAQFFDLRSDPGERDPIPADDGDPDRARLEDAAGAWYEMGKAVRDRRRAGEEPEMNRTLREDLEALGYIN